MSVVGEAVRLVPDKPLTNGDCIPACMRACRPSASGGYSRRSRRHPGMSISTESVLHSPAGC